MMKEPKNRLLSSTWMGAFYLQEKKPRSSSKENKDAKTKTPKQKITVAVVVDSEVDHFKQMINHNSSADLKINIETEPITHSGEDTH